jgi:hypothetical protein
MPRHLSIEGVKICCHVIGVGRDALLGRVVVVMDGRGGWVCEVECCAEVGEGLLVCSGGGGGEGGRGGGGADGVLVVVLG